MKLSMEPMSCVVSNSSAAGVSVQCAVPVIRTTLRSAVMRIRCEMDDITVGTLTYSARDSNMGSAANRQTGSNRI